jgi:hypothetical protein
MKRIFLLWISLAFALVETKAQLNVQVVVPLLPPRITDLFNQSGLINIIIINPTLQDIEFKVIGTLSIDRNQLAAVDFNTSPRELIGAGQTKIYQLNDLAAFQDAIDYGSPAVRDIVRSGYIPAGYLNLCFRLVNANNANIELAAQQCRGTVVTSYQPPITIYPDNNDILSLTGVSMFRWVPVTPSFPGVLNYRVQVFEILPGQDAMMAFRANQPIWERQTNAAQMPWPFDVPREAGTYVWTVRAFDSDGNSVGAAESFAEYRQFSIPNPQGAGNNLVTIPTTAVGTRVSFFPRGSQNPSYEMIMSSTNTQAIQEMFDLSDQALRNTIVLTPVMSISGNGANIASGIYNTNGDLLMILTEDGPVLSFNTNRQNADIIGRNAGVMNVFKSSRGSSSNGSGSVNLALDRVRRLADACAGIQTFLVF